MDLHARNSVFRTIVKRFEKGIVSHIRMMRYSETSLQRTSCMGPTSLQQTFYSGMNEMMIKLS